MNTYEVFLKKAGKEEYRHAGALDAPDDDMARLLARETYSRRGEGALMWVVARTNIIDAGDEFLAPNFDKPHRHNDGSNIAARRKRKRTETENTKADRS